MLFVRGKGTGSVLEAPFEKAAGFTCVCAVVYAKDAKRMWDIFKSDPATFEGMLAQWVNRFEGNRVGGIEYDSTNFSDGDESTRI